MSSKKFVLIANAAFTIVNFRRELIMLLVERGHTVVVLCPKECSLLNTRNASKELSELGAQHRDINVNRQGINPLNDLKLFFQIAKIIRQESPDFVLNYTIKPTLYGSIAAKLFSQAKIFSNVTGLGYLFTATGVKVRLLAILVKSQYYIALKCNTLVFFQNSDDLALMKSSGLLHKVPTKVINGSGVNLSLFENVKRNIKAGQFVFVGRLLVDKGVLEYVAAAEQVKQQFPEAEFLIVGPTDSNPAAISEDQIEKWQSSGIINYIGPQKDVSPYLASSEVFVLPSYREGTPRSTLEAMAIGMPIITTDAPGCKETVIEQKNGYKVPVKNSILLAEKMMSFLENPKLSKEYGAESLKLVREKYEITKVINSIIEEFEV